MITIVLVIINIIILTKSKYEQQ